MVDPDSDTTSYLGATGPFDLATRRRADSRTVGPVRPQDQLPTFARGPVFAIAAAMGLVLLAFSGRYGYFSDELYFLAAGQHLAWGYADQPWLVPLLARVTDEVTGGSLVGLRLPATIVTISGVVVTALIARELGGQRGAQVMAAGASAASPYLLATGHLLATSTLDPFGWTVIIWLVVRWVRTREQDRPDDRLLLLSGVVTALTLQVKFLIPAFWLALGVSVLVFGPRELLRRPMLWVGAALAGVVTLPTLVWQARNHWPYLQMTGAVSHEMAHVGGRLAFLPLAGLGAGLLVGVVLGCYGLWRLLRSPQLRPYRFLGATALGVTAIMLVANGRPYYVAGLYGLLWAVAAVELQRHRAASWWRWVRTWPVYALSALLAVNVLPWQPVSWHAGQPTQPVNFHLNEIGWPQLAGTVADIHHGLPPAAQRDAIVVSESYGAAAAIDRFGPQRGAPDAYSPSRGYWYFGAPPADTSTIIYVGASAESLRPHFATVRQAGQVDNGLNINNALQGAPIWVCQGPRQPWSQLWPQLRAISQSSTGA
ncbi:MAG: glycosyltransferase [Pseudonocardiaceae bacterium]|nr:glycosyltransferase [Pseudonocardiaceae bacterium]